MLYLARESTFDAIYQRNTDNRRMRDTLGDLNATWAELNTLVEEDLGHIPAAHDILRDGHCHEAVMWYVHHLTTDIQQVLAEANVQLPLLSTRELAECPPAGLSAEEADAFKVVCANYQEKVTCASCHSDA